MKALRTKPIKPAPKPRPSKPKNKPRLIKAHRWPDAEGMIRAMVGNGKSVTIVGMFDPK